MTHPYPAPCCCCCECCDALPRYLEITLIGFTNTERCSNCPSVDDVYIADYYDYGPHANEGCPTWLVDFPAPAGCAGSGGGSTASSSNPCRLSVSVSGNLAKYEKPLVPGDNCYDFGDVPLIECYEDTTPCVFDPQIRSGPGPVTVSSSLRAPGWRRECIDLELIAISGSL